MTTLALINNNTNICENVTLDDRPINEIIIDGYTVLNLNQTPTINWVFNETLNDYEQVTGVGDGGIGFTYINGTLTANKPTIIKSNSTTVSSTTISSTTTT